ncbi:hypothetical protein NHX12_029577 [Muraenolepis orangiensis]|uniref:B30.2/SPRY domain-containing protein n=1 Tax=Muraenolepis orangiensis TaxID=630683 RepID=A0A9Q0IL20_9TELE|nr:hypothetical protein NHX12_029577 [Muraenolepis orangiensis]
MSLTGETGPTTPENNGGDTTCLVCGHPSCPASPQTLAPGLDQRNNCPGCQQAYDWLVKKVRMCSVVVEAHEAAVTSDDVNANNRSYLDLAKDTTQTEYTEESECPSKAPQKKNLLEGQVGPQEESDSPGPPPALPPTQHPPTPPPTLHPPTPSSDRTEMDEPKSRLASQVREFRVRLDVSEGVLRREKEREEEARATNRELRAAVAELLDGVSALSRRYGEAATRLIEGELGPGEAALSSRVGLASRRAERLRDAVLSGEALLTEEDATSFTEDLDRLRPSLTQLMSQEKEEEVEKEGGTESKLNVSLACSKLEEMNAEFKSAAAEIHRALRNVLNPSEVTFDPDTAHPNLVLSDDMKTATYSPARRPGPASPRGFTSFMQVLSSQSFTAGEHCWRAELEGAPWAVGVCYGERLARAGLPSALESSPTAWCLMWFENRLRAFERGHGVPLKLTSLSRTLELRLSFGTQQLSFYDVGHAGGMTHVYTFHAHLTEPVHLAYRMMSAHPKARVTIYQQ